LGHFLGASLRTTKAGLDSSAFFGTFMVLFPPIQKQGNNLIGARKKGKPKRSKQTPAFQFS
jgi:hypothetical protein